MGAEQRVEAGPRDDRPVRDDVQIRGSHLPGVTHTPGRTAWCPVLVVTEVQAELAAVAQTPTYQPRESLLAQDRDVPECPPHAGHCSTYPISGWLATGRSGRGRVAVEGGLIPLMRAGEYPRRARCPTSNRSSVQLSVPVWPTRVRRRLAPSSCRAPHVWRSIRAVARSPRG